MKKLGDVFLCILNSFLSFNSPTYAEVVLPMPKNVITHGHFFELLRTLEKISRISLAVIITSIN